MPQAYAGTQFPWEEIAPQEGFASLRGADFPFAGPTALGKVTMQVPQADLPGELGQTVARALRSLPTPVRQWLTKAKQMYNITTNPEAESLARTKVPSGPQAPVEIQVSPDAFDSVPTVRHEFLHGLQFGEAPELGHATFMRLRQAWPGLLRQLERDYPHAIFQNYPGAVANETVALAGESPPGLLSRFGPGVPSSPEYADQTEVFSRYSKPVVDTLRELARRRSGNLKVEGILKALQQSRFEGP